ncbi:conjugal transfer protein TrbC [Solicola sp. PLA-1-18]|uniref:conjugal transfer protein TrbC n=1 Tax=Solicola sp. PLA-1-18 TaxID=3380532 RepID=UPI003B7C3656
MFDRITTTVLTAVPDPTPSVPADVESKVNIILGVGMWLVIAACVAGVLIAAGKMALAFRRGELGESFGTLGGVAAACVLVGTASAFVGFLV